MQNANAKKTQNASDRKKRKTAARSLIISGESLKATSEQTNYHIQTIKKLSSKENLQQSQLKFLKTLRDEKLKEIKAKINGV